MKMDTTKTLLLLAMMLACRHQEIQSIELSSVEIKQYLEKFSVARDTDLILMRIASEEDSTMIYLFDLYSTCLLRIGDEYGYLINDKWKNITAPMFKTRVGESDVYIESGIELISKSRSRYNSLRKQLPGRVDFCVEKYDKATENFTLNPPRTSTLVPWKMVINREGTHMKTYTSKREGFDDFFYEIETIRIDTNYLEQIK